MNDQPLQMLDFLGDHFSGALNEPEEALQEVADKLDQCTPEGRYELVRKIAQGGLKSVTLEKDSVTGREVAVSTLKDKQPVEEILRFINEAWITSRLEHNNIVPLYDFGRRDGSYFFASRFLTRSRYPL